MNDRRPADSAESRATAGWVVAVLLEPGRDREPGQRYFAIGRADRAQAEWVAIDMALSLGLRVAASPARGEEPVQALAPLSLVRMRALGLASGSVATWVSGGPGGG